MRIAFFLLLCASRLLAQPFSKEEVSEMRKTADRVTIIRDTWGVPHIYGKSDADAVFGMIYVQCEDDFARVETNYINALGRMAEVRGADYLFNDLRMRLFIDSLGAIQAYQQSPAWLKKLCDAFASGANYYLHTHPDFNPQLLTRFKPWMPFLFSEGSIGGDIETVSIKELRSFYGAGKPDAEVHEEDEGEQDPEPKGSNGIAIAPELSSSRHALLLINPHTSHYFRSELQVVSKEGLNAYGAVTWGQFFVYQGFNEHCGWMHTSSAADAIDEYEESIVEKDGSVFYQYGNELRPLPTKRITLAYRDGPALRSKTFTTYFTHHGPVVAAREGKYITVKLMVEPLKALTQSYMRTKANGYDEFNSNMELLTNSSNNTVFADDRGNIAYYHGNFIPIRDTRFDWSHAVDGSNPDTEWKGLHPLKEIVQVKNPRSGWIQNCNSTPFTVAGPDSPKRESYPSYMATDFENERGVHAVRLLEGRHDFTLDKLIATAFDSYLPGFESLMPSLLKSFDEVSKTDSQWSQLKEPVEILRAWDLRWGESSVATTLAIYFGSHLRNALDTKPYQSQMEVIEGMIIDTTPVQKLEALGAAVNELAQNFGTWQMKWGDVNRFQRLTGNIEPEFDDLKPSLPVGFTSSFWGSLASYGSRKFPGTKKLYGTSGNSFVAVVEFGPKVKAKTVVTGGSSSDPKSTHFTDQAKMFCEGKFKEVNFYETDVKQHAERSYHPGTH